MNIGIVIPTLNEETNIARTLDAVINQPHIQDIVVVDGGSRDKTLNIVKIHGIKSIIALGGRGPQLEAGWRSIQADIIWFLHADTVPPPHATTLIKNAFSNPKISCTAFRLSFDTKRWDIRFIAFTTNIRSMLFNLPYGDQAIAVRRKNLEALGRIPPWRYLEDVWLVDAMRQHGKIKLLPAHVTTSVRRYITNGVWSTFIQHKKIMAYWRKNKSPKPGDRE